MVDRRQIEFGQSLLLAALTTITVVAVGERHSAAQGTLRAQLIGHWRLVSSEHMRDGAAPVFALGPSPAGMITYTADGHMQAQLAATIRPKVRPADATPDQQRELLRTYPAYFGTFDVDETARTVTHHRHGSQAPGERDFVRTIDLRGNRLVLTTPTTVIDGTKRFARITWERLGVAPVVAPHVAAARAAVTGTWELVEHKTTMGNGDVRRSFGSSPSGLFIFHEDGHTTVQVVNPDRPDTPLAKASDDQVRALTRSYLAYFGTFDVDPATKKIVVHTIADLNPANSGADQIRFYELQGDMLYLQPPPTPVAGGGQQVSRISWRRVK